MNIKEIQDALFDNGYIANREISIAVSGAVNHNIPLLIEGAPGVGKTSLAKAVSAAFGFPLLRVQFYEGLTYDKILYDFDYQRQLLTIETMRSAFDAQMHGKTLEEAKDAARSVNFYGEEFLIKRPIVKAFSGDDRYVLLLDEVDKSSEEIEYTLLEALDEYTVTIPQFGPVVCPPDKRPVIILTSNNYRELSDALRRRCGYLYLEPKSIDETKKIIMKKAEVNEELALAVAKCMERIKELPIRQMPSIAEAITWAEYLKTEDESLSEKTLDDSIFMIMKNQRDREILKKNKQNIIGR